MKPSPGNLVERFGSVLVLIIFLGLVAMAWFTAFGPPGNRAADIGMVVLGGGGVVLLGVAMFSSFSGRKQSVEEVSFDSDGPFPLLHDPPGYEDMEKWWHRIPIIGWTASFWRWRDLEVDLEDQPKNRGPVPESAWEAYEYDESIRQAIEAIVIGNAYPKGSTCHPLDPGELMFVLRYGDLNEVALVQDIEERFGFDMPDSLLIQLIEEKTTFIDFIRLVERERTSP